MTLSKLRCFVAIGALLALPAVGYAQESTVIGTMTDTTGGVLPGVTITAVNEATGNVFLGVTDGLGAYRIGVRIGTYTLTAELPGFQTVAQTGLSLQVGQQVEMNLQLAVSALEETVTVSGEAPLLDVSSSNISSNIDQRQVQELPLNGRNWLDLTLLAPGSRANHGGPSPVARGSLAFQINVDGQQVKNSIAGPGFGQPRYSRDSIAEFEFVSNRFDATQGRSMGVLVNGITKSGTNTTSGLFSGYFRSDKMNAPDHITDRVLPYANSQLSATLGGPLRQDRIHYFANLELEREPETFVYNSIYPFFNKDVQATRTQYTGGVKMDIQFTPQSRMSVRGNDYKQNIPCRRCGGARQHPSYHAVGEVGSRQYWGQFTNVLGNQALNEVKVGYFDFHWIIDPFVSYAGGPKVGAPSWVKAGATRLDLPGGYRIGSPTNLPQNIQQDTVQLRNDFTFSFAANGRHDVKIGGEFLQHLFGLDWCSRCNGHLDARSGTAPDAATLAKMFPVWDDASTWSYNELSPNSRTYRHAVGDFGIYTPRRLYAAWLQDDWRISQNLTLNLGIRYDADIGVIGEKIELLPWMSGNRSSDLNNIQPRVGLAYSLDDRTVLRGGYGLYYTQLENDAAHQPTLNAQTIIPEVRNDGRADFAMNPFNGPTPTHAQVSSTLCSSALVPGCIRRVIAQEIPTPGYQISYAHMASVGFQRQVGEVMAVEANYVYTGSRAEEASYNMNMSYNSATGANYPSGDYTTRPYPNWGMVDGEWMRGYANSHAIETSFTKRFADRWQLMATYTLGVIRDSRGKPCQVSKGSDGGPVCNDITFPLALDVGGEYGLAATDQRHRAVVNGIWDMGMGFQLSGLYFYGSGMRINTHVGRDNRDNGQGAGRLRTDGTIMARNDFVGLPLHRIDMRLQKRFALVGRATIDGIVEVFNLLNHENYGSYNENESSSNYMAPEFNSNISYKPRIGQVAFRLAF